MNKEIKWINGLKAICAFFVFFHHFVVNFYPGILYGFGADHITDSGFEARLATQPYSVFFTCRVFVCVLFVLTSFLYAYKRFTNQYNGNDDFKICLKRYIQLLSITFTVGVIYYLFVDLYSLLKINIFGYTNELNHIEFIQHNLFIQWFKEDTSIVGMFWSMKYSLACSVIGLMFSRLSSKERWYMPIVYIIIGFGMKYINSYFACGFFGIALADIFYYKHLNIKLSNSMLFILAISLIFAGLYIGGYPTVIDPTNSIHVFIKNNISSDSTYIHSCGSFILLIGILVFPSKKILESKIFQYFGKMSLSIYVLHGLVIRMFSKYIFKFFIDDGLDNFIAFLISFIITCFVLVFVSHLYQKFVYKHIQNFNKKIYKKLNIN